MEQASMTRLAAISLFALSWSMCVAQPSWDKGSGTELSCSIILWGNQDYNWKPPPGKVDINTTSVQQSLNASMTISRFAKSVSTAVLNAVDPKVLPPGATPPTRIVAHCLTSVRLARQRCGGKGLNFVPTHFYKYLEDDVTRHPDRYCYKTNLGDDQVKVDCAELVDSDPMSKMRADTLIDEFYVGMKACVTEAINVGFTEIKITPHLDDGTGQGGWRNLLGLNPVKKCHGYSYVDIMLMPIARAIKESLQLTNTIGTTKVMFTLQGEMNFALVAFPQQWQQVAGQIRTWVMAESDSSTILLSADRQQLMQTVKVGVSLNFNKLCGDTSCHSNYRINAQGDVVNQTAFRELIDQMDFMGISNYPSVYRQYQAGNLADGLEGPIGALDDELSTIGFKLTDWLDKGGKEFHLSEFGIGGGQSQCGCEPAQDVSKMADLTYFGMFGIYGHFQDPWKPDWAKQFQQQFYSSAIRWLANKGGPRYRVDGAFLWCMSSWDVAGIYWTSYNANNESYYNPEITSMIQKYNNLRTLP